MAKSSNSRNKRTKPKDNGRKPKKKISPLNSENVQYIDYKDVDLLKRFVSDRSKIRSRRVSGNDSQQQREVARAIKNAREMGLLAYTSRVTTQRRGGGGRGREDGGGRGRDDRPPRSDSGDGDGGERRFNNSSDSSSSSSSSSSSPSSSSSSSSSDAPTPETVEA